jgi:putative membrane protein
MDDIFPIVGLVHALLFSLVGMALVVLGYCIFDLMDFKIDYSKEIRNGNTAAAIVLAAFILGLCLIISRAIGS